LISSGGERGLLGLAFHPDYANNGYFFVNYTNNSGHTVVSRFSVDGADDNLADPNSELNFMTINQPYGNHNGGNLAFGPDGYLYIGTGDGGSGGDPGNRAQNPLELLGKMLRIDVDNPSGGENYGIPADNPYVGDPNGKDEIWAIGLRNPWRYSFDETTGDLWIGDVGQNAFEEINRVHYTEAGLNYGWRCYEANAPYNTSGCPDMSEMTFPVAAYTESESAFAVSNACQSSTLVESLLIAFSFSSNLSQAQDSSLSSSDSSLLQDSLVGYVYSTSCYKPTNGRIKGIDFESSFFSFGK
jgi:glucose/arabinose dehydrogenase